MKENHAKMSGELKDKETWLKIFEIENEDYRKRVAEIDSLWEELAKVTADLARAQADIEKWKLKEKSLESTITALNM